MDFGERQTCSDCNESGSTRRAFTLKKCSRYEGALLVDAGIVVPRGLQGRRKLNHIDIARLHFDLHLKNGERPDLFGDNPENSDRKNGCSLSLHRVTDDSAYR